MKKTLKRYISIALGATVFAGAIFAQDFDDFGFDDDFGSFSDDSSSSPLTISGSASVDMRGYVQPNQPQDMEPAKYPKDIYTDASVSATLEAEYSGNNADADVKLTFNEDIIKNHPEDVIDELTVRGYFGDFQLEAGKMKIVWGKGDKLHVLDNFNADDYTDFIIPDYIDRRISTPMLRAQYALPSASNFTVEAVYTPFLPVDRFAEDGPWVPERLQKIESLLTTAATTAITTAGDTKTIALMQASALNSDNSIIYPDTYSLKYSQAGLRTTFTLGSVDLGASYYYGHYKQPSFNLEKYNAWKTKYFAGASANSLDSFLAYDMKQTFGLEAASIIWHFNVRGEVAYNLTEDIAGDDPWVHNNSLQWLAGFDIDLPFWNANLNVQETGTWILHSDKIEDDHDKYMAPAKLAAANGLPKQATSAAAWATADVDYNEKGYYTNNRLVVNFTTSFMNDKIAPEITLMWGIENGDLVVMPKFVYKPFDTLKLTASGMAIFCAENSEFYSWKNNSFVNLGATISF